MITGLFAGITWALETVLLGAALSLSPFFSTADAVFLAPFVSTFLHDGFSALFMLVYNGVRGKLPDFVRVFRTKGFFWLFIASAIGGPVGMSGYVLAVNQLGPAVGAVASAVYPAVGTALACLFLKEKVRWYQWIFLLSALFGVYGLSGASGLGKGNLFLGLLGAGMCAFGWGVEAVILAKCFRNSEIKNAYALSVRQATSALLYGAVLLPLLGGWRFTAGLFSADTGALFPLLALAALSATVSYLFYYKAIAKVGASRAMALNITYTAWSVFFSVILFRDISVLQPKTLLFSVVVVVCGVLAAADLPSLFRKGSAPSR